MNAFKRSVGALALAAAISIPGSLEAQTANMSFLGTWNNTTFATTGGLEIQLNITGITARGATVEGAILLSGNVFGDPAPRPPITFSGPARADGSSTFSGISQLGTVNGTLDAAGTLSLTLSDIVGGFPVVLRVNGLFALAAGQFNGLYEMDFPMIGNLFASGTLAATLQGAPVVVSPGKFKYRGSAARARLLVYSATPVGRATARAPKGTRVVVRGTSTVNVIVRNATRKVTRIVLQVPNAAGRTTARLRFTRQGK